MAAMGALLALLAANTPSQLDCLCSHISNVTDRGSSAIWRHTVSDGERQMWWKYCQYLDSYSLHERCEALEQPSPALAAAARLLPWDWTWGPPPAAVGLSCGEECECGAALEELRALTREEARQLRYPIADAITDYWSAHGLNDTIWTAETLPEDQQKLSQLLHGAQTIVKALNIVLYTFRGQSVGGIGDSQAKLTSFLKEHSKYWRRRARLLPLLVTHASQLFIPLAFQHTVNHMHGQQLHGWIKNMERVTDMLDMKFIGLVHDVQFFSEQAANYKIEEDKDRPGNYKIRRPLLSDGLMEYQPHFLSFHDDFGALCEKQLPQAPHVFGLADTVYSIFRSYFSIHWSINYQGITVADEEWQLEDQSNATVWVDTGCLQLLADAVDHPRCPLEELPLEASRRRQCRETLWRDLVERPPRPPVTSYLAYSERTSVSLCLLAWMAANSRGLCEDVPFSITQSVRDATCYFESPNNQTCLQSNTTDAICSVSRAILLLKCRDFSSDNIPNLCQVTLYTTGHYSDTWEIGEDDEYKLYGKATETALSFKESLNSATLKYRDFKVESLKPLEYSFIAINIFFRLLTASVYVWLPHLRNLPGKILLSFQLTGLAQVLCSEVVYRAAGFPDLSTAALVDSCLTLLGCLWLNTFSYQMFSCVRDLRLPDHLTPAEASIVFRRQLRWALIPWAMVSTACAAMEKSSKHYLLYSRITLTVAISSSVALNLVLLSLVAFIYFRSRKSMTRLNIIGSDKGFSKKQLTFMSVNTIILSGICVIIRIGFHQATGIAQYVYYVHIATMLQGPVLFVFLACNGKTLPALKNRLLSLCWPDVYRPELELGSAAKRNLARRRGEPPVDAETAL